MIEISTHDLTKRSTFFPRTTIRIGLFQLTTSRRGRRFPPAGPRSSPHFNSRPHEEVDYDCPVFCFVIYISTHDLTKRSTPFAIRFPWFLWNFNSRPHEEVDVFVLPVQGGGNISTHDLTKRSTQSLGGLA